MLKFLLKNFLIYLSYLFNCMKSLNYFPQGSEWTVITHIAKPRLDHQIPSNFRLISLLSVIFKPYEFVLVRRLDEICTQKNLISESIYNFRAGHSIAHQLLRVVEKIQDGLHKHLHIDIIFLDVSKAFDKAWILGLTTSLLRINLFLN